MGAFPKLASLVEPHRSVLPEFRRSYLGGLGGARAFTSAGTAVGLAPASPVETTEENGRLE
jgi:hypothetical protein